MKTFKHLLVLAISITFSGYSQQLSKEQVRKITGQIPDLVEKHYVLKEKRQLIANAIQDSIAKSIYIKFQIPDSLAKKLTNDLRAVSKDMHLYVKYIPNDEEKDEFDWDTWEKKEREDEIRQNYGFTQVKILEGNIGYLKITEFMNPQRGMQTAVAAMKFLENTRGLIIDIRDNGGGYAGLMEYILNHYFDGGPSHISTTHYSGDRLPDVNYSSDLVYGKLRVGTPLCIIINEGTGSASEYFAYTLQTFEKAKIVGEKSHGAAHRNTFFPLNENFRVSISTAAPVNPITKTSWEGTGVIPDIQLSSDEVNRSLELIQKELQSVEKVGNK
ncbi:MAG: S41 family peptidase [Maribacter sp.]